MSKINAVEHIKNKFSGSLTFDEAVSYLRTLDLPKSELKTFELHFIKGLSIADCARIRGVSYACCVGHWAKINRRLTDYVRRGKVNFKTANIHLVDKSTNVSHLFKSCRISYALLNMGISTTGELIDFVNANGEEKSMSLIGSSRNFGKSCLDELAFRLGIKIKTAEQSKIEKYINYLESVGYSVQKNG